MKQIRLLLFIVKFVLLLGLSLFLKADFLKEFQTRLIQVKSDLNILRSKTKGLSKEAEIIKNVKKISDLEKEESILQQLISDIKEKNNQTKTEKLLLKNNSTSEEKQRVVRMFMEEFFPKEKELENSLQELLKNMKKNMGLLKGVKEDLSDLATKILRNHLYSNFDYYSPVPYASRTHAALGGYDAKILAEGLTQILFTRIAELVDKHNLLKSGNHYNVKRGKEIIDIPDDGLCLLRSALYLKLVT